MQHVAQTNLDALRNKKYTGRGIILGRGEDGSLLQVCWMTGRSPPSRNRLYARDGGRLYTATKDGSDSSDPNLFYDAMDERESVFVVSNGNQTKTVVDSVNGRYNFYAIMRMHRHEGEKYRTSRITGIWVIENPVLPVAAIAQLRKNPWDETCDRSVHRYETIHPGFGYCVTTYQGDSMEPERFLGEPYLLPLTGTPIFVMETLWNCLHPDTRLGIAVKSIDPEKRTSEIWFRNG